LDAIPTLATARYYSAINFAGDRKDGLLAKTTLGKIRLTPDHAAQALHVLIADGKIAAKAVTDALKRRESMIADLRKRLAALEAGVMAKDGPFPMSLSRARRGRRKAKRKVSAARRAALKLHGRYLGLVRTLPKAAKAKIKAIREKSGVKAAIAAAKRLGR